MDDHGDLIVKKKLTLLALFLFCLFTVNASATSVDFSRETMDAYLTLESGVLTLSKWGGEATLSFGLPVAPNTVIYQNGSFVELSYGNGITAEIYNVDKGIEYLIVFNTKITQLNHQFPVTSQGLEWYYQPPLDEELIGSEYDGWTINDTHAFDEVGMLRAYRPLDVVGSYAVYGDNQGNEYQTGKFTHLYRPWIYDSTGAGVWGVLSYDSGVLTVSCDSTWLKKAVYPVYLDPSFGYDTVGASEEGWTYHYIFTQKETLTEDGDLDSVWVYCKSSSSTVGLVTGVYSDDGGGTSRPLTLLGTTFNISGITTTPTWRELTFDTPPSLEAGTYWLTLRAGTEGENPYLIIYYDAGGSGYYRQINSDPPYPDLPASLLGLGLTAYNLRHSVYVNYTVSGGATAFNRSVTQAINLFNVPPTVTRHYTGYRLPTTGINIASSVDRVMEMTRGVTQSINLASDAIRSGINAYIRGVSLTFSTGSTTTRLATYFRGLSQGLDVTTFTGKAAPTITAVVEYVPYLTPIVAAIMATWYILVGRNRE